jgi:polyferredoxin
MGTKGPMTDADRSSGSLAFAAIGGMLATGIAWVNGLALLPGLGWGLIWGVIGLLVGAMVYFVVMD